ncbi:replication protein [Pectobacterium parmentieri]|uniref:replication protein n=1 Tax=Pectobacterium parmentieri TaxID=1905730 RepID=UPI000D614B75|nr:replication protein [Pectobacterium parmentieri]PWD66529.1 phage replication protein [Pectobacterium parmentieri]RKO74381.1 phage replication protein [Pectobacterium parmentieri]
MNTAEVIKFPGPEPGQQEQRVADTDDGYTRLANELLEELIGANLTRNQAKVAFAVCRKTYGFNKKTDRIADSQLSALTRLPRQKVNKAKNELIAMKVLIKDGLAIGPNKNLSEWSISECHQDSVTVTKTVTKSVTKTVTAMSPKQGHTKDTITKDNKDSITPIVPVGDVCEKPPEQDAEEPPEQSASQSIKEVFSHWQAQHNHPTSKLDPKRRKRINARLEEGFSVAELCKAISGAKYDAWLMGKNPSNRRYDGIETILRDAAQVEKLRDLDDNEHAKAIATGKYSATTARNLDTLQRWAGGGDNGAPF